MTRTGTLLTFEQGHLRFLSYLINAAGELLYIQLVDIDWGVENVEKLEDADLHGTFSNLIWSRNLANNPHIVFTYLSAPQNTACWTSP